MVKRSREDSDPALYFEHRDPASIPDSLPVDSPPPDSNAYEAVKIVQLDPERSGTPTVEIMQCSLPGHRPDIPFNSLEDYEVHYNKTHVNRCVECRKNFPTDHFLTLHQVENHDPLVAILKDRGEHTYACFVEVCERKCSTPQKRRLHLIDKHMFPKDYDFFVVNDGIDGRSSMLRSGRRRSRSSIMQRKINNENRDRQRTSTSDKADPEEAVDNLTKNGEIDGGLYTDTLTTTIEEGTVNAMENRNDDMGVAGLTGAMSALRFVPPSVRFGRGRGRAGFSKT